MKKNILITFGLWAVAILLLLNLVTAVLQPVSVFAQNENTIGRYQISAWASPSKGSIQFAGYYVIDTTTGKVINQQTERLSVER